MNCLNPITLNNVNPLVYPRGLTVPCGKCLQCRIQKRREWSLRMLHELDNWHDAVFLTLTYSPDKMPIVPVGLKYGPMPSNGTLVKKHLQDFIKRLRRDLDYEKRKIKYFACGEYGDERERPHYHAIIYGIGLSGKDKNLVCQNWTYCDWNNSSIFKGSFGVVEPDSIRYVAQYIDKKYTGELADKQYKLRGREPVFRILSQGIGKEYIYKCAEQMYQKGHITHKGIPQSIPRYYLNKLDEIGLRPDLNDSQYEAQCEKNQALMGLWMSDREILRASRPDVEDMKLQAEGKGKKQHELNLKAQIAQKRREPTER